MKGIKSYLLTAAKGFGMGAANVVPGVSGGTIALLTGIYSELIEAINGLMKVSVWKSLLKGNFREFWKEIHGSFLLSLFAGVVISIFSLAKFMKFAIANYPVPTWAFFFGLILASAYFMFADVKGWKWGDVAFTIIGVALGVGLCFLSPTETPDDLWFIAICGAIAVCTMILPGISGSFVLLILGKYDYVMTAVAQLNIPVLVVFAIGCGVGILAFAKFLHWLLGRCERQTMLVLVGFVIGSLVKVWPWHDMNAVAQAQALRTGVPAQVIDYQIPYANIFAIVGIALVALIEFFSRRRK